MVRWGVPINPYQTNVILCPDKKGQCPKEQLSPSKVLCLARRRQSSAGSSLRTRSQDPPHPSSLKEPGAQPTWSSGSSGLPNGERPGPTDSNPGRRPLLWGQRHRDRGEVHCLPQRLAGGLGEGSGAIEDTASSLFSGVPAKARWAGGPQGEGPDLPLTSLSTLTTTAVLSESYH